MLRILSALGPAFLALSLPLAAQPPSAPPKLFSITFTKGPKWDAAKPPPEQAFMKEHSANLFRLRSEGRLVLGGRFGEYGLIVLRLPDAAAVQAELAKDPSVANGTFAAAVDPFYPIFHGSTSAPPGPPADALRGLLAAFNKRDAAGVAATLAPDVKWFSVGGKENSLEGDGREALQKWLEGYFKSLPDVKSEIFDLSVSGPRVMFRERVSWTAKDGSKRAQESLGVCEVKDGLIAKAWYFPAEKIETEKK